jgi:hypothetical protein
MTPMNERLRPRSDGSCNFNLLGCGALRPGGYEMRKQLIIRWNIKVDVADCLRAIAFIIYLLM